MSTTDEHDLRIFVSYSRQDKPFVDRLVADIRRALGKPDSVWYDVVGLEGGDDWIGSIEREITARPVMLLVLSPDAVDSYWVNEEIKIALNERKKIIPIMYRPCKPRAVISTRQAVSFLSPRPFDSAFDELMKALSRTTRELNLQPPPLDAPARSAVAPSATDAFPPVQPSIAPPPANPYQSYAAPARPAAAPIYSPPPSVRIENGAIVRRAPRRVNSFAVSVLVGVLVLAVVVGSGLAIRALANYKSAPPTTASDTQQVFRLSLNNLSTLDPHMALNASDALLAPLIFPGLVEVPSNQHVTDWAASNIAQSDGGTTYTFTLHSDMTWSDGTPLTASDFAFSLNRSLDPCVASPDASYLYPILDAAAFANEDCSNGQPAGSLKTLINHSITAVNPTTLVVKLQAPSAYFLMALTTPAAYAVPQALVSKYGNQSWSSHLADGQGLGGSLFKVTQADLTKGTVTLDRNSAFWGAKPKLREIVVKNYQSSDTAYSDYTAGNQDFTWIPTNSYNAAKTRNDYHQVPEQVMYYFVPNYAIAPFDDLRMRQAFALALNKQTLVNSTFGASATSTNHIVPQGISGYNANILTPGGTSSLTGDSAKALSLAQAYAKDKCGGELSACPPVTVTSSTGSTAVPNAAVQMWQQALPGYRISAQTLNSITESQQLVAKKLQLAYTGWIGDYPDLQDWLSLQFSPGSDANFGNASQSRATTLMQQADAQQDPTQRVAEYQQAEQLLLTDGARIPVAQAVGAYLVSSTIFNFSIDAFGMPGLDTWQQVYVAAH